MLNLTPKLTIIFPEISTAVCVMNNKSSLQCRTYYFLEINFNIIPLSAAGVSKMFSPFLLCDKIFNAFF
jgi:hypothetical protein